jgi:predicted ABC-type ATPase
LSRVRRRADRGGHDIPEAKIRERWRSSRENLVRLLPQIHHLRVYDNSHEADPVAGEAPQPLFLLEMRDQRITAPEDLSNAPEWAQPILAAAMKLHLGEPFYTY